MAVNYSSLLKKHVKYIQSLLREQTHENVSSEIKAESVKGEVLFFAH